MRIFRILAFFIGFILVMSSCGGSAAGNPAESAMQLVELLRQLQMLQIQVEVLLVQPEHRLPAIARSAARAPWTSIFRT